MSNWKRDERSVVTYDLEDSLVVHTCNNGLRRGTSTICNKCRGASDFSLTNKEFQKRKAMQYKSKNRIY